jgi:hypothetical protein
MVLPEDFRHGDPGSTETPQHHPVIIEDLFLLRLCGPSYQFLRDYPMEFPVNAGSANSGSFYR